MALAALVMTVVAGTALLLVKVSQTAAIVDSWDVEEIRTAVEQNKDVLIQESDIIMQIVSLKDIKRWRLDLEWAGTYSLYLGFKNSTYSFDGRKNLYDLQYDITIVRGIIGE